MNLSDDRINFLSHQIITTLRTKGGTSYPDESKTLAGIKQAIHQFGSILEGLDSQIRHKIGTLKRNIPEGSREWDLLYRQYFDEELSKKGL